jgi:hypothetical protein
VIPVILFFISFPRSPSPSSLRVSVPP